MLAHLPLLFHLCYRGILLATAAFHFVPVLFHLVIAIFPIPFLTGSLNDILLNNL